MTACVYMIKVVKHADYILNQSLPYDIGSMPTLSSAIQWEKLHFFFPFYILKMAHLLPLDTVEAA